MSKLCNVLFSQELARRLAGTGVTSYVLHPGVVASDIWRRVPWPSRRLLTGRMLTVEQGAQTSLYCATAALAAATGRYYDSCAEREPSPVATAELAGELWAHSEAWTARLKAAVRARTGDGGASVAQMRSRPRIWWSVLAVVLVSAGCSSLPAGPATSGPRPARQHAGGSAGDPRQPEYS